MLTASTIQAMRLTEADYDAVRDVLLRHHRFVLTTHRDPDADGLGSEAALAEALRQLGKDVRVINDGAVPPHYRFIAAADTFEVYRPREHRALLETADVLVILDAAEPERTGRLASQLTRIPGVTVAIDHHQTSGWAALDLIDPTACATAEVVDRLLERLPIRLTPTIAEALYAGIVADTLSFRTARTSPDVHRRAARLLERGASVTRVHEALFASWPLGRLRLLGEFLSRLEQTARGRIIWGVVTQADLRRWRQTPAQVEGFVEEALTVRGAEMAVLFLEGPESVRVSLRSRQGVRVDHLAQRLGGGGHTQAAGARLALPLATAVPRVLHAARRALGEQAGGGGEDSPVLAEVAETFQSI